MHYLKYFLELLIHLNTLNIYISQGFGQIWALPTCLSLKYPPAYCNDIQAVPNLDKQQYCISATTVHWYTHTVHVCLSIAEQWQLYTWEKHYYSVT